MKKTYQVVVFLLIAVLTGGGIFVWSLGNPRPSAYQQARKVEGVVFQASHHADQNEVAYTLVNGNDEEIVYGDICALEYLDGSTWKEIVTGSGQRAADGAHTGIGIPLDAKGGRQSGVKSLDGLKRIKDGTYRLMIPVGDGSVLISENFQIES